MAKLTVHFNGLGLWVDRGGFWEILFPAAEKREKDVNDNSKGYLARHDPVLFVLNASDPDEILEVYDLRDCQLDLTQLADDEAGVTFGSGWSWMIQLPADATAKAKDNSTTAFWTHRDFVTGKVTTPKVTLAAHPKAVGPIEFDNVAHMLAYELKATATLKVGSPELIIRRRDGSSTSRTFPAGEVLLLVQNLSTEDRLLPPAKKTKRNTDPDFAAHYLLTSTSPGKKTDVPKWKDTPKRRRVRVASQFSMRHDPEHLCTPAYVFP